MLICNNRRTEVAMFDNIPHQLLILNCQQALYTSVLYAYKQWFHGLNVIRTFEVDKKQCKSR